MEIAEGLKQNGEQFVLTILSSENGEQMVTIWWPYGDNMVMILITRNGEQILLTICSPFSYTKYLKC